MADRDSAKYTWGHIAFFTILWPTMLVTSLVRYEDEHRLPSLVVALGSFCLTLYMVSPVVHKVRSRSR